jgi:hypothetical protein
VPLWLQKVTNFEDYFEIIGNFAKNFSRLASEGMDGAVAGWEGK